VLTFIYGSTYFPNDVQLIAIDKILHELKSGVIKHYNLIYRSVANNDEMSIVEKRYCGDNGLVTQRAKISLVRMTYDLAESNYFVISNNLLNL
jgi:hypothetical protein